MNFSFLTGLVIGCMLGAMIHCYLQKFTGNRREMERYKEKKNEWDLLFNNYSLFMNQLKNDINEPMYANIREFFVVDKTAIMNSSIPRLRYDLIEEIMPALHQLEALGYIQKLPNDSLLYKMEDDFVTRLKAMREVNLFAV
ncbi:hypothetical protein [Legionella drancourtii]|uniref:Uncharacterized protein n=1 Tax=Legionella drancourtii LLAP12 TaxID=658187 RepID=G9ETH2_9GAMM|nr:hypothetical protein [Legionella drancourtii]EHL29639.1 hypothetical protein LDG_8604 [Legionella drancourtii LLAP12]